MDIQQLIMDFSPFPLPSGKGCGHSELEDKVRTCLAAPWPEAWIPTTIGRSHYLDITEHIVRGAHAWVDADGRVLDPVLRREVGQTSPRFASPGAILLHFGRAPEIRDAVFRCMDHCCRILPSGQARGNSPDFWMRELATAYMALGTVASPDQLQRWGEGLSAVEPEIIYTRVSPDGENLATLGNWVIYAAAGEAMRETAGLKPGRDFLWGHAFFDRYVGAQTGCFTEHGMYRDPGDPITYDVTTRLQVACALAFGYAGNLRAELDDVLRRGGLTTLLFTSPEGFCPYGGRSAAFNFREAILTVLCEFEARRYKKDNPRLAGAFKRQAHLSAESMGRWMLQMKPWRNIKNGFDPDARHGNDVYGNYSTYSLLAASFLGLAAVVADDTIPEAPCPSEIGGFAFELAPEFHKVFANCRNTYLEIDTAADPHYDATGLGCFALKGVPLELGPAMPFPVHMGKADLPVIRIAPPYSAPAAPVATGPAWQVDDTWTSLAGLSEGLTSRFRSLKEAREAVHVEIEYTFRKTSIVENYRLENGTVTIKATVLQDGQPVPRIRFIVPLLVTDGSSRSTIREPHQGSAGVDYLGHACDVRYGDTIKATLEADSYANRNGVYRSLVLETAGHEIQVELRLH